MRRRLRCNRSIMSGNLSDKHIQAVIDILSEQLGVARNQITGPSRIVDDLGADSLTVIEITMALEERFGATIPDEQLEGVHTVDELYDVLAEAMYPAPARRDRSCP